MASLPDNVDRFISRCLDSPLQLEALLRILLEPLRGWTGAQLAQELRISTPLAEKRLEELCARSLLSVTMGNALVYRYAPATPELAEGAMALQRICITQREDVLVRIMARGRDQVSAFADAFKLGGKKGGPDGR